MNRINARRILGFWTIAITAIFYFYSNSYAELITSLKSQDLLTDGIHQYVYTLDNNKSSTLSVSSFVLNIGKNVEIIQIVSPDGWNPLRESDEENTVIAWDINDPSFTIKPGASAQFSIISRNNGAIQSYGLFGISDRAPYFRNDQGTVLSPAD